MQSIPLNEKALSFEGNYQRRLYQTRSMTWCAMRERAVVIVFQLPTMGVLEHSINCFDKGSSETVKRRPRAATKISTPERLERICPQMNINHRTAYPFRLGKAWHVPHRNNAAGLRHTDSARKNFCRRFLESAQNDHQMNAHETAIAFLHLVEARVNEPAPGPTYECGIFHAHESRHRGDHTHKHCIDSANVQMHTTTLETTGTTMRPLNEIIIAPDSQIVFQPGGNHLMISNLPAEYQITASNDDVR